MKKKFIYVLLLVTIVSIVAYFIHMKNKSADILLLYGKIHTMLTDNTKYDAIVISDGLIMDIGQSSELKDKYIARQTIDLRGASVYPGFIDSHAHMYGLGMLLSNLNLVGLSTPDTIVKIVADEVKKKKPGEWIFGRGWDHTLWPNKEFPTKHLLDSFTINNPVVLSRIDGHAVWVNQRTLDLAKIDQTTLDPEGGKIIRDKSGYPTGILIDNAIKLIEDVIPPSTDTEIESYLLLAMKECVKYGLTEIHDMGLNHQLIKVYKKLLDDNKLLVRVYGAINAPSKDWDDLLKNKSLISKISNDMLTIKAVKMYADGALGSRGAALIESYSDDPNNRGLTLMSNSEMEKVALQAIDNGFQVCIHAIGDRANHIVLNLFEKIIEKRGKSDYRFRIEHAQVLAEEDVPRFSKLQVIPSMQPVHCVSDMDWAEERLGPQRIKGAYAWRSLLNTGAIIASGSDFPNDIIDPIVGFYAAVTRSDPSTKEIKSWYPEQCMTREEALKSYTLWAAFSAFREKQKGTIEIGKYADLTILSNDILTIPLEDILSTEVLYTIVNGKIVYSKN